MMFSVIIPVFNRAGTILPTLQSVQTQTCCDFECLVIDDGSDDDLENVVGNLKDERFRYIRQPNSGANSARNRGIDEAKGEYLAFLDSDDLFLPTKLEVLAEEIAKSPNAVLFSNCLVDRGTGKLWERPAKPIPEGCDVANYLFVKHQHIQTSTICLKRMTAAAICWDEELKARQDFDFCLRLAARGAKFRLIPQPLIIWRDVTDEGRASHAGGLSASLQFLAKNERLMSWRSQKGYRANVLAADLAIERPLTALKDLAFGLIAGVSPLIIARQTLRAFVPRNTYRRLLDHFVSLAAR